MARDLTRVLIFGELGDASHVSLLTREGLRDKDIDEMLRFVDRVLTSADRDEVGVVMLACEQRRGFAPDKSRASTPYFVCRDLLAVARATEHNTQALDTRSLVRDNRERGTDAETRIVVQRVKTLGSVVDHVVSGRPQVPLQVGTEFEAGVIGRDVDAHLSSVGARSGVSRAGEVARGIWFFAGFGRTMGSTREVTMTTKTPQLMPTLSAGRHRTPRQGACFMEFASYLAGERWSDHPRCTHPLLAALARDVNDLTDDESRNRLMPLVNRVIGLTASGSLSDDVTETIAVRAALAALPIASYQRQRAIAVGLLSVLDSIHPAELQTAARRAVEAVPHARDWARDYLDSIRLDPMRLTAHSAEALVHTSTVGIALACIPDADDRLASLLEESIIDVERIARPKTTPVVAESEEPVRV